MQTTNLIKPFIWLMLLMMVSGISRAQSKQRQTEKQFAGLWVNKHTTRHLEISFENGYATIIDWTSNFQKRESGDIYKALLRGAKLVMPEDSQHRAPYSEILYKNNTLIYLSKPILAGAGQWDKEIFIRSR